MLKYLYQMSLFRITSYNVCYTKLLRLLHNQEYISSQSIGGAQENLSKNYIENIPILHPSSGLMDRTELSKLIDYKEMVTKENILLGETLATLLSKIATIKN